MTLRRSIIIISFIIYILINEEENHVSILFYIDQNIYTMIEIYMISFVILLY